MGWRLLQKGVFFGLTLVERVIDWYDARKKSSPARKDSSPPAPRPVPPTPPSQRVITRRVTIRPPKP